MSGFDYGSKRPDGQYEKHPGLSKEDAEEIKAVKPVRLSYRHEKCGEVTTMPQHCAETYARIPYYYARTFCCSCKDYFPVGEKGEFVWLDDGTKVGT